MKLAFLMPYRVSLNDLVPEAIEGITYQGEVYAVPFDFHTLLWHLNKRQNRQAMLCWVWQQDAKLFISNNRRVNLTSASAHTALQHLSEICKAGFADPSQDYMGAEQASLNGDSAVLLNGTWVVDSALTFLKFVYENESGWAKTGHLTVRKSVLNSKGFQAR